MSEPLFVIPNAQLPPGFAEKIDEPAGEPVEPKPAATVVLLREGEQQLEVLLLKRHRASGFVPGAYVFPGGRVDAADASASLITDLRLPRTDVSARFWIAALREAFEETGVLLARDQSGAWIGDVVANSKLASWRDRLLLDQATLAELVQDYGAQLATDALVYFAHWITPRAEPRRFDTRFFAAALPAGSTVHIDAREMDDAVWLSPATALARFAEGRLPMVFPTVRTLHELSAFHTVTEALAALRARPVLPILPRLVRTPAGVGIVIEEQ